MPRGVFIEATVRYGRLRAEIGRSSAYQDKEGNPLVTVKVSSTETTDTSLSGEQWLEFAGEVAKAIDEA